MQVHELESSFHLGRVANREALNPGIGKCARLPLESKDGLHTQGDDVLAFSGEKDKQECRKFSRLFFLVPFTLVSLLILLAQFPRKCASISEVHGKFHSHVRKFIT